MICCSILKALLTEYSSTSQSSNLGLSLEYHAQCKKSFEVSARFIVVDAVFDDAVYAVFDASVNAVFDAKDTKGTLDDSNIRTEYRIYRV